MLENVLVKRHPPERACTHVLSVELLLSECMHVMEWRGGGYLHFNVQRTTCFFVFCFVFFGGAPYVACMRKCSMKRGPNKSIRNADIIVRVAVTHMTS